MNSVNDMLRTVEAAAPSIAAARAGQAVASAERIDSLVLALSDIARHYGRAIAPISICSGLPLIDGHLPIEHIELAAERAGLKAHLQDVRVSTLTDVNLPLILLMADGSADVLWALRRNDAGVPETAILSEPGAAALRVELTIADLTLAMTGKAVLLKPATGLDERGTSSLDTGKTNWFIPAFLASRRIYGQAIAATIAINLLALAMPLFTMNVYDRVLPNAVEETLWALAIGVTIATLFDFILKLLRSSYVDIASRRADVILSNFIYGRLLGARTPEKSQSAGVRANSLREFESVREFVNSATLTAFGDAPFLILFLAMLWVIAGPLAWIPTAMVPIMIGIGWLTQKRLAKLTEAQFRETAQKNAVAVETIVGLDSVKAAGAESWAAAKWEAAVADNIRSSHEIKHYSNLGMNTIFVLQNLTQIAMILAGFYLVAKGDITTGALIAGTMLAGRALQPLGQIAMLIARLHQTRLAFQALSAIVDAEQERAVGANFLAKTRLDGAVTFEGVSFTYDKDTPSAVDGVSFQIKPGERVGIIGSIGSGKSTILKLLHAIHRPTRGQLLIDGLPLSQLDPAVLRSCIGYGLQDADLFHGTIRSNIALADPGASDDDVVQAARAAGALDWIARMPKGFDTPVRERGAGLSGGQRQSVTLARALFKAPQIVMLDEPTSDMDSRSEQGVVNSLNQHLSGRTLLFVTHRPAVLAIVDRLIVLENGRKLLDGPKAQVLKDLELIGAKRAQQRTDVQSQLPNKSGAAV